MNDLKTKIIWLSDIHIAKFYDISFEYKDELEKYFAKFWERYIEDFQKFGKFDYIILNGDVAFTGSKEDYDYFNKLFLDVLKGTINNKYLNQYLETKQFKLNDIFNNTNKPYIIAVPGNHDICWEDVKDFLKYTNIDNTEVYNKRQKGLIEKLNELKKCFQNYSGFVTNAIAIYNQSISECEIVSEDGLYGYIIDYKRKLIFNLINTAWFSIGSKFDELLTEYFNESKISEIPTTIKTVISTKSSIGEYGNQMVGSNLLHKNPLLKNSKELNLFTSITIQHHPTNWLHWNEQFKNDSEVEFSDNYLNILRKSNFLLTGHEHLPVTEAIIFQQSHSLYNLRAGCFLEELKNIESTKNGFDSFLDHNRYAILIVDNNEIAPCLAMHHRLYDNKKHEWNSYNDKQDIIDYHHKLLGAPSIDSNLSLEYNPCFLDLFEFKDNIYYSKNLTGNLLELDLSKLIIDLQKLKDKNITIHIKDLHLQSNLYQSFIEKLNYENVLKSEGNKHDKSKTILAIKETFNNFHHQNNFILDQFKRKILHALEIKHLSKFQKVRIIVKVIPYWLWQH